MYSVQLMSSMLQVSVWHNSSGMGHSIRYKRLKLKLEKVRKAGNSDVLMHYQISEQGCGGSGVQVHNEQRVSTALPLLPAARRRRPSSAIP
jgi:hypothetical protein